MLGLVQPIRAVSATLLSLALLAGNAEICAGWVASPQARMACCAGHHACAEHESARHGHHDHAKSQSAADRCCALSEPNQSAPAQGSLAVAAPPAVSDFLFPLASPDSDSRASTPRLTALEPPPDVPRHLLLSVFLV